MNMDDLNWTEAGLLSDLQDGDVSAARCMNGTVVALYLVDGTVYATAAVCTHGAAQMSDGFLEGHEIECPLHQGRFDIRTGKALSAPLDTDIKTYPVKIEGDKVFVSLT